MQSIIQNTTRKKLVENKKILTKYNKLLTKYQEYSA